MTRPWIEGKRTHAHQRRGKPRATKPLSRSQIVIRFGIVEALRLGPASGIEIEQRMGLRSPRPIGDVLEILAQRGLVERRGLKRSPTGQGRMRIIWALKTATRGR